MIDTVELWSLEHQRKISLRFLAAQLLGESIQVRGWVVVLFGLGGVVGWVVVFGWVVACGDRLTR